MGFQVFQRCVVERVHFGKLFRRDRTAGKQRLCVIHGHIVQLRGVILAKLLLRRFAELQHGACAALEAHRGQQCRAVCKQAGGCGGLVFLRECFVSLFEDDRVPDEDGRKQQKQQRGDKDDPERGFVEKSCPLAAVRGVVLRIVRLRVILLQFLTLRYARAVAVSFLACADRRDAALGLLGGEVFKVLTVYPST